MQFLALSGSARQHSTNLAMLQKFCDAAPSGTSVVIYDQIADHPIFSPDYEPDRVPAIILDFVDAVRAADGIIIAAPEYAHGIPGGLKNALDWLVSDPQIPGKPAMLVHASTRGTYVRAQLREVLTTMSLNVYKGPDFERHLMNKNSTEIAALLSLPDQVLSIKNCLKSFDDFVRASPTTG